MYARHRWWFVSGVRYAARFNGNHYTRVDPIFHLIVSVFEVIAVAGCKAPGQIVVPAGDLSA